MHRKRPGHRLQPQRPGPAPGTGGIGAHYDANRLTAPLVRRQSRGAEEWAEVTWGEALDLIAEKMLAIRAEHGPEAMAMFSHGIGGAFLKHTFKAYGTPNLTAPSYAQCRGPREVGFQLTFGEEVSSPERTDIALARTSKANGFPMVPTGNPLVDGVGPASWAPRRDLPELDGKGHPKIVPLSGAEGFHVFS